MIPFTTESAALCQWGVVLAASLAAALWDIRCRRIPNVLTLPLLALGLVQAAALGGWAGFGSSLSAMIILALPYIVLFLFAGGGAGDVKLMGALGAWLGLSNGVCVLLAVSICAIFFAMLNAALHQRFFAVLRNIQNIIVSFFLCIVLQGVQKAATAALSQDADEQAPLTMPYGPAIFAGAFIAALWCS